MSHTVYAYKIATSTGSSVSRRWMGVRLFLFVFTIFFFSSCSYFKKRFVGEDEQPIARAGEVYLYPSDVEGVAKGLVGADSIKVVKAYTEKWLRQQMLLQKAKENIPEDDPGIIKKIEDYRQSLILYEYEKALIADKLDTAIRSTEIQKYYDDFGKNFPLQQDVYLVQFIRLKEEAPDYKDIRKLILNTNKSEEEEQKIEGYAKANSSTYAYANPLWYSLERIKSVFYLEDEDVNNVIQSTRFREFKRDDGSALFVKVVSKKIKGEPMPVELAKSDISKILIEKRKMKLIEQTYERVFTDGISSKNAELYVK